MYPNQVNDCSTSLEPRIPIRSGIVTLTMLLVFLLESILLEYNTKIYFVVSNDTSIQIRVKWITVVSVLNHIFLSNSEDFLRFLQTGNIFAQTDVSISFLTTKKNTRILTNNLDWRYFYWRY